MTGGLEGTYQRFEYFEEWQDSIVRRNNCVETLVSDNVANSSLIDMAKNASPYEALSSAIVDINSSIKTRNVMNVSSVRIADSSSSDMFWIKHYSQTKYYFQSALVPRAKLAISCRAQPSPHFFEG